MTIINRYIITTILKYFAMALVVIVGIFIAIDYLGTMDEFIAARISLWRAFFFVLLRIPFVGVQLMPVVLLLAILITFGLMSKNNELIVINAGGISIYSLLRPVMLVALLSASLHFYLAESVVPPTMAEANRIQLQEIRKKKPADHQGEKYLDQRSPPDYPYRLFPAVQQRRLRIQPLFLRRPVPSGTAHRRPQRRVPERPLGSVGLHGPATGTAGQYLSRQGQ